MAETFMLSVKGLQVGYGGKPLIRDIAFELPAGRILTLIGPNGAGKSTILKTITRQLSAQAGTVMLDGRDMERLPRGDLAKKMSVLLTERVRPDMMTCFDVAAMGRYPYTGRFGRLSETDMRIVHDTLRRVRAEEIADRDFTRISDGQRQRVMMARALCQEPEVMVLDEPTSYLDIRHKIDLLDILQEESRAKGLTVILSLHEIDLAEKVSDLIMCVKGDTIWRFGPPADIFQDRIIAELYGLDRGSYLTGRGSTELARPEGEPRVFVIGGGGRGIMHYRTLQRKRMPFAAGILQENDRETDVAQALAQTVILAPAFEEVPDTAVRAAREAILRCGAVLDAGTPVGKLNHANADLLAWAESNGIRTVRSADELD